MPKKNSKKKKSTKKTSKKRGATRSSSPPKKGKKVMLRSMKTGDTMEVDLEIKTASNADALKSLLEQVRSSAEQALDELSLLWVPAPTQGKSWDEKLAAAQTYYGGTACAEAAEELGIARVGYLFAAFRYMWRAGWKPGESAEADLKAAEWYLTRAAEKYPDIIDEQLFIELAADLDRLKEEHDIIDAEPS